jgi:hypothetical protein
VYHTPDSNFRQSSAARAGTARIRNGAGDLLPHRWTSHCGTLKEQLEEAIA